MSSFLALAISAFRRMADMRLGSLLRMRFSIPSAAIASLRAYIMRASRSARSNLLGSLDTAAE